jgi:predicted metal-dependent phosphoesterase TrpH
VIVGEEVKSSEGEIIGLFLSEEIPGGLTPEETAGRIRAKAAWSSCRTRSIRCAAAR